LVVFARHVSVPDPVEPLRDLSDLCVQTPEHGVLHFVSTRELLNHQPAVGHEEHIARPELCGPAQTLACGRVFRLVVRRDAEAPRDLVERLTLGRGDDDADPRRAWIAPGGAVARDDQTETRMRRQ